MSKYKTTLNEILKHNHCGQDPDSTEGWKKLLKFLDKTEADDEPLGIEAILESNGFDDALLALKTLPEDQKNDVRLLACDFAERALKYTKDPRPAEAIRVARAYARGEATAEELNKAKVAAAEAAREASRAAEFWAAAYAAAYAAEAADAAARAAAYAAASWVAYAAGDEEQEAQLQIFRRWLNHEQV